MGIKSELHEAILKRGGKVPPYGGIAAAMDELNKLPGGGVSSWNDLTDKPFYKEIGEADIFPDTRVNFADGTATVPAMGLVAGEVYTVVWNIPGNTETDATVDCVAVQADESTVVIGNMVAFGGEDTGEPFCIADVASAGMCAVVALDGASAVWLTVRGNAEIVYPLDYAFVPDGMVKIVDFVETADSSFFNTVIKRRRHSESDKYIGVTDIYSYQKQGYQVIGRLELDGRVLLFQLVSTEFERSVFTSVQTHSTGMECLTMIVDQGAMLSRYEIAATAIT